MNKKLVVITGASSGFGMAMAMAKEFSKDGYNQWKENVGAVNITAADVARTIKFAYELPQSVLLREIIITDTMQDA